MEIHTHLTTAEPTENSRSGPNWVPQFVHLKAGMDCSTSTHTPNHQIVQNERMPWSHRFGSWR